MTIFKDTEKMEWSCPKHRLDIMVDLKIKRILNWLYSKKQRIGH